MANSPPSPQDYLERLLFSLSALDEISLLLTEADFNEVSSTALRGIMGVVPTSKGVLYLHNAAQDELVCAVAHGLKNVPQTLPLESNQISYLLSVQTPIYIQRNIPPSLAAQSSFFDQVQSYVVIPLVSKGVFFGILSLGKKFLDQSYTEEDFQLLWTVGHHMAIAIANTHLYNDLNKIKNYNQDILTSISNGVLTTNLSGQIVQINPSVLKIFDLTESPQGKSAIDFFRHHGCIGLINALESTIKTGHFVQISDEQILDSHITLNARVTPLFDNNQHMQGVVITLEDLSEEMRIRSMFKQYTSDQIVNVLLSSKKKPELGGIEQDVTILVVDIRGSVALVDRIGAEKSMALINACFSRMVALIFKFNGTLEKFTGDGFQVLFGAPVSFPDDTERAVQTALALRHEMTRFNKEIDEPLSISFGISRGRVLAGNIGSVDRMDYTVIGRAVNLANRFCDGARAGHIWTGQEVFEEVGALYDFSLLGYQRFKGIGEPVRVYELLDQKGIEPLPPTPGKTLSEEVQTVDISLPIHQEMELVALQITTIIGSWMEFNTNQVDEIKLALAEVCINAFEHSQTKENRIYLSFEMKPSHLTIYVTDRGHGFNWIKVRSEMALRNKDVKKRRGRGLQIVEGLMDKLIIQSDENGTIIIMQKNRHPGG